MLQMLSAKCKQRRGYNPYSSILHRFLCRTCSDPEVDSSDDKKLDADMYEDATDEEDSDDESYMRSIENDDKSLLSM